MLSKPPPKCCICCNVKFGTILIAALFMMGGFGGIIALSYSLAHPYNIDPLPEVASEVGNNTYQIFHYIGQSSSSKWLSLALYVFISLIASLSIVGVVKLIPKLASILVSKMMGHNLFRNLISFFCIFFWLSGKCRGVKLVAIVLPWPTFEAAGKIFAIFFVCTIGNILLCVYVTSKL